MSKYQDLLRYIRYFEGSHEYCTWSNSERETNGIISPAFPQYDRRLEQFIQDVYETDLMEPDYLDCLERRGVRDETQIMNLVKEADMVLLKAILTYYVRQERFCDGLWGKAAENKTFLSILRRLKTLVD